MQLRRWVRIGTWIMPLALLAGCASSHPPMQIQGSSNNQVDVSTPDVDISHGIMTITGDVRRKPGVTANISGRVDVIIRDRDGKILMRLHALLTPDPIPTDGRGESQYTIRYGWIPPAGAILQAHFVDALTAQREDANRSSY